MILWKRLKKGVSKKPVVSRLMGKERDKPAEHRAFLGQWYYCVGYYNGGYISLYIDSNSQNIQQKSESKYKLRIVGNSDVSL